MKLYFHELDPKSMMKLTASGITWGEVMERYSQPEWCEYPNALEGVMGCWSLVSSLIKDESGCKSCECYKNKGEVGLG